MKRGGQRYEGSGSRLQQRGRTGQVGAALKGCDRQEGYGTTNVGKAPLPSSRIPSGSHDPIFRQTALLLQHNPNRRNISPSHRWLIGGIPFLGDASVHISPTPALYRLRSGYSRSHPTFAEPPSIPTPPPFSDLLLPGTPQFGRIINPIRPSSSSSKGDAPAPSSSAILASVTENTPFPSRAGSALRCSRAASRQRTPRLAAPRPVPSTSRRGPQRHPLSRSAPASAYTRSASPA